MAAQNAIGGVKDGAVILSGHVPGYAEKLAAAQAAERVNGVKAAAASAPGVAGVESHLVIAP